MVRREHVPEAEIAVRAHVEPPRWRARPETSSPTPEVAFLLHAVRDDAPSEPLAFAVFGYLLPGTLEPAALGIIDPTGEPEIRRVASGLGLRVLSPREFAGEFRTAVYYARAAFVSWDTPRDLVDVAIDWRPAKGADRGGLSLITGSKPEPPTRRRPLLRNGEVEDGSFPRLVIRLIDSRRALVRFRRPARSGTRQRAYRARVDPWQGRFVSVRTLAEALTGGERYASSADAGRALGLDDLKLPVPGSPRERLCCALAEFRFIADLYRRCMAWHHALSPDRPPDATASPGTYARALLRRMGATPILWRVPDFPRAHLATATGAFFGGETFLRFRGHSIPGYSLDFGSAFGTAAVLAGTFDFYAARSVKVVERDPVEETTYLVDAGRRIHAWMTGAGPPLASEDWRRLTRTFVHVRPEDDALPHRRRENGSLLYHRASLRADVLLPYTSADAAIAYVESGKVPSVGRAILFAPSERRIRLRAIELPTGRRLDPNTEDPIRVLLEERARLETTPLPEWERRLLRGALKGIVNSLVSGLPIQVNDDEPSRNPRAVKVHDPRAGNGMLARTLFVESPGNWYFPPIAAGVEAGSRLLAYLAKGCFEAVGATVFYGDVDSLFVAGISWAQLQVVRARIEEISPFTDEHSPEEHVFTTVERSKERNAVLPYRRRTPRLLKVEPENYDGESTRPVLPRVSASARKRYVVFHVFKPGPHVEIHEGRATVIAPTLEERWRLSRITVAKASRHGLPYVNLGEERIAQGFEYLMRLELGLPALVPSWWGDPAIALIPATRPDLIALHPDARPLTKLALCTLPLAGGLAVALWHAGMDPLQTRWYRAGKDVVAALFLPTREGQSVLVGLTLGGALLRAWRSPERGALDVSGAPCAPGTKGPLAPAPTVAMGVALIGKESRRWEEQGIIGNRQPLVYAQDDPWPDYAEALRDFASIPGEVKLLSKETGVPAPTIRHVRRGRPPSQKTASH